MVFRVVSTSFMYDSFRNSLIFYSNQCNNIFTTDLSLWHIWCETFSFQLVAFLFCSVKNCLLWKLYIMLVDIETIFKLIFYCHWLIFTVLYIVLKSIFYSVEFLSSVKLLRLSLIWSAILYRLVCSIFPTAAAVGQSSSTIQLQSFWRWRIASYQGC